METKIIKATPEYAKEILDFLKIVGGESDNLTFGSEGLPMSIEEETKYLASIQNSPTSAMFLAIQDGIIIGNASFNRMTRERLKHRGDCAVSVKQSMWGKGIGSKLLEVCIDFAKHNHVEIISLEVRSDNIRAIKLYEKYGFEKIGHFKGFLKHHGVYIDCDLMNLYLNK